MKSGWLQKILGTLVKKIKPAKNSRLEDGIPYGLVSRWVPYELLSNWVSYKFLSNIRIHSQSRSAELLVNSNAFFIQI